jgi:signal transduction histidine kinase
MHSGRRGHEASTVEIRSEHQHFRLLVRDDGKGIEPAVLAAKGKEGRYGLRGMASWASRDTSLA